jgi:hypothetical protein
MDRSQLEITTRGASAEEAAAIAAAVEQFLRDNAPEPTVLAPPAPSAWQRAALAEGVARRPDLRSDGRRRADMTRI